MGLKGFLKNNWGKIILSVFLFIVSLLGHFFFKCIGGTKYLCGPPILDFITYFLGWPLIFFMSSLSYLLGKSIFAWIVIILFFIIQFLYLYFLIYFVDWLINRIRK